MTRPIRVGGKWSWVLHLYAESRRTLCGQPIRRGRDVGLSWREVDQAALCADCRAIERRADKLAHDHREA